MAEPYVEVRPGNAGWYYQRRAGNHRRGRASNPYTRWDHAARAAGHEHPDLEVRVFDAEGRSIHVRQPYY